MTEKTRSISISSGGIGGGCSIISAPILISGPVSSSPSSLISVGVGIEGGTSSSSTAGTPATIGHGGYMTSNTTIAGSYHNIGIGSGGGGGAGVGFHSSGNDGESELLGHELIIGGGGSIGDNNSIMNSSQISTASNESVSIAKTNLNLTHNIIGSSCRFPKLEECAHFHYERVQLGSISARLADDKSDFLNTSSIASQSISGCDVGATTSSSFPINQQQQQHHQQHQQTFFNPSTYWFIIKVISTRSEPFLIKRSFDNLRMLDEMLHRCVYDRKISGLKILSQLDLKNDDEVEYAVGKYLERFSKIASDSLTCGTVLTWFQLDNKGRRLPLADTDTMRSINTPAVGAAYGVRRYVAQACDEISIEVGDMISVIDMPSPAESVWWRGKKSHLQKSHYEVGFFPQSCVATIGDKVPRHFPLPAPLVGQLDVSPTKPVLRKHGKLIAFFRSFILSRPSRRRLKQSGIYRERVFSCDLSEHLLNSGQEIPMVLKCCAEFIEEMGIVDGIYRLSGITSNIQKLRRAFDEERVPDLTHPEIKQDIHAVSSLLKMYFRELPNPLCTYQLYDNFVEAIQTKSDSNERLRLMKETVLKLPPPHYRTLKYLATHLSKISKHSANTGMTDKNLAIVWAPNLLRSPALESGGVAALRGVGVQAVVTEYLIRNCNLIFDPNEDYNRAGAGAGGGYGGVGGVGYDQRMDSLTDCESLLVEQREHDQSLSLIERPKSLSAGGAKLISLEEAQERHSRSEGFEANKSIPINTPLVTSTNVGSYIEVGGGPSSLPDKYHTVLPVPRSWQKRKTHSWKSLFMRNPRNSNSNNDIKTLNVSSPMQKDADTNNEEYSQNPMSTPEKSHHHHHHHHHASNGNNNTNGIANVQSSVLQPKQKSIDLFDGKPMEICVRSNSIDSLRTAGHSRSVSHDSYFDLLQSPLRGIPTCTSRELSELGLNFDREEPEMRIFSESESLVSSPKVGKENIPPARRVLRARPEEFSNSTTNSVNPSPKKQPRLNLLSPHESCVTWNTVVLEERHNDESCCKRYKLEDQLSDIQFIDCSTPEHTLANSNTVYTSVQVHNPPATLSKSSSFTDELDNLKKATISSNNTNFEAIFEHQNRHGIVENSNIPTRYSYPGIQFGGKRKDNDAALKERFSYPGSGNSGNSERESKYICRMQNSDVKMNIEEEKKDELNTQRNNFTHKLEILKPKNRYSYCESLTHTGLTTDSNSSIILRSSSADLVKNKNEMERSKLSVATPSSPTQSPRYSLLVGETSSENSSAVNTPVYDMDLPSHSGIRDDELNGRTFGSSSMRNFDTKDFSCIVSEDSCSNLTSQLSQNTSDKRDISALKRELSLDLEGGGSKMSVDLTDISLSSNHNKQIINIQTSPNNSNFTHTSDNTSQSITPSEFGYQHLNRHSNIVSLENSPHNCCYDTTIEQAFLNYDKSSTQQHGVGGGGLSSNLTNSSQSLLQQQRTKSVSPIKSTISITYNLKSPIHKKSSTRFNNDDDDNDDDDDNYETVSIIDTENHDKSQKPLLETSFDENMVYEQVKFFRSSVSEVNQLLNNGNNEYLVNQDQKTLENEDTQQIVPNLELNLTPTSSDQEVNSNLIILDDLTPTMPTPTSTTTTIITTMPKYSTEADDILMTDNIIDSLEIDQNYSLYENIEMRKPSSVYENIDINSTKTNKTDIIEIRDEIDITDKKQNQQQKSKLKDLSLKSSSSSSKNFSVKQLATKFETSPIEQLSPFDFNNRQTIKTINTVITNRDAPCYIRAKNHQHQQQQKQQLNKSAQITRSLDENAFIREFGHKQRNDDVTKSVQQIEKLDDNRRKSLDFVRSTKVLNQPKRLPNFINNDETKINRNECCKTIEKSSQLIDGGGERKLKLDLDKIQENQTSTIIATDIKITPTTENRISLIQNNVIEQKNNSDDDRNSPNLSSMKVLSGCKLDRERIERIKEERRHQLNEKYRSESFKSKSKTELRDLTKDEKLQETESLRIKSKSRGDIRTIQKDFDNLKGTDIMPFSNRVRRISDEKNQNNNFDQNTTNYGQKQLANVNNDDSPEKLGIAQKFDRKPMEFPRERDTTIETQSNLANINSAREKISPQFSIRDVTAMFESRSQNQ